MWDKIAGGIFGTLAGATAPKPYKGTPFQQAIADARRRELIGTELGRLEGWASGQQPLVPQAVINRMLSGQNARLEAAANAGRARATERWIESGEGPRSGSRDRRLAEIDRSLIDAKRQQAAPLLGQLAMAAPEYRMRAQGMLGNILSQAEQNAMAEHQRMEQLKAARKAFGSGLHRALAGGLAGFSGVNSMPWKQGGGGGGGSFLPWDVVAPTPQGTGSDWMNENLTWDLEPTETGWS